MAENLITKGWYPTNNFKKYSYASKLQDDNPELFAEVSNLLSTSKTNLSTIQKPQQQKLKQLCQKEREKEEAMLRYLLQGQEHFTSPKTTGEYIQVLNRLFSLENIFERNITKILKIEQGGKDGNVDITSVFEGYLRDDLKNRIDEWAKGGKEFITQDDLKDIFRQAMIRMFSAIDNGKQAYIELANALRLMIAEGNTAELDALFYLYFGKSINEITKEFQQAGETVSPNLKNATITGNKGFKGNVLEFSERIILNELKESLSKNGSIQIIGTGQTQMKTDNMMIIGFELTKEQQEMLSGMGDLSSSLRAHNIERMQRFHDNLQKSKQQGYVVEISDKSYNLTSNNFAAQKGFTAQNNVKLTNLKLTLQAIKYQRSKIDDIIFILANSGQDLINGQDTETVMHNLATLIAYFLFDDIEIKNFVPSQPAAVHLLNLDGIYIPLSVFLEAAYKAFETSVYEAEKYVNVTFHEPRKANRYNNDNILTKQDWVTYREARMNESTVSFHFFGNFVNFIKENVRL